MWNKAYILCNGMDDSLQKIDISPFKYGTVSAYDVKPIPKKKMSYLYNREGSDGKITNEQRETITVDTLFDFFHHLFAPLSTANRLYFDYAVEEREDGTWYSDYQEFRYFLVESECDWDDEEQCLIDAIRLFKTSRAGFGIAVLPEGGIGVNDLYHYETNMSLQTLPIFTLDDNEKKEFQTFYKEFRGWYTRFYKFNYGPEPSSKDYLTKKMLDIFRSVYRCDDIETAFMVLSGIWELFAQQFPEEKSPVGDNVTRRIKESVSRMVRNTGSIYEWNQDNLFIKVGYLYEQRSIIVHKDKDKSFDKECVQMAFDITRCLILKLFYAKDKDVETIVHNLEYCDKDEAAYKMDSIRCPPASKELMKRIIKYAEEQKIRAEQHRKEQQYRNNHFGF
ncbi:MAG: hypothetical protein J5945_02160 [Candidatus Methanomethylophilus sp.]|nr:hypothetical protein [Methanomethylophilus sp.]